MRFIPVLFLLASLALISACGTTDETREETREEAVSEPAPPPPLPPPQVAKPVEPPVSFEARTDTVLSAPPAPVNDAVVNQRPPETQYLVQIGAFKDAEKATRVQNAARERLKKTVLNDYNTLLGMYQIRVGYFETREAAAAFRDSIVRDYPEEYKGSWIVQFVR
jgi:cell division septation protein DedD